MCVQVCVSVCVCVCGSLVSKNGLAPDKASEFHSLGAHSVLWKCEGVMMCRCNECGCDDVSDSVKQVMESSIPDRLSQ